MPELVQTDFAELPVRRSLAVVGTGSFADISDEEADYLASLPGYDFIFGTADGNPGKVMGAVRASGATLFQPEYARNETPGVPVRYTGGSKEEFRENFIRNADAVLVLGGEEGTLHETMLALSMGKPVVAIKDYGAVAQYLSTKKFNAANLHIAGSIEDAARMLYVLGGAAAGTSLSRGEG